VNLTSYKLKFDLGTPFYPFQQLMGVLPAASKTLLPVPYQVRDFPDSILSSTL
jgi:5'-3' exoribonuclease 1